MTEDALNRFDTYVAAGHDVVTSVSLAAIDVARDYATAATAHIPLPYFHSAYQSTYSRLRLLITELLTT